MSEFKDCAMALDFHDREKGAAMSEDVKLCKDCAHMDRSSETIYPKCLKGGTDMVFGKPCRSCEDMRLYGECGLSAALWVGWLKA